MTAHDRPASTLLPGLLLAALVASAGTIGCSSSNKPPQVAPAASQGVFAMQYGDEVTALVTQYGQHKDEVRTALSQLPAKASDAKNVKGGLAAQVVDAADQSGQSEAYVEERKQIAAARAFFAEGKTEIGIRVAGAAQAAAKGCADVSGAVMGSLKDAVDKSAEKQLQKASEAHLLIERNRTSLGPQAAVLEKLADDVANASYVVHVELPELRDKLKALVAEADQVKRTADEFLAAEGRLSAEPGRSDADKKSSQARVEAMNKGKAAIDPAVSQAKAALAKIDDEIVAINKEYADALAKLRRDLPKKLGLRGNRPVCEHRAGATAFATRFQSARIAGRWMGEIACIGRASCWQFRPIG